MGVLNPETMLTEIPEPVFLRWMAFSQVEPFGERRRDYRMAILCWVLATLWSDKDHKPDINHFFSMFGIEQNEVTQDPDEMAEECRRIAVVSKLLDGDVL